MSTEFSNETLEKNLDNTGLQIVKESEEDRLMTLSVRSTTSRFRTL